MFSLTEFWGSNLYHLCGIPLGKKINTTIDCNTPGIPKEANTKFLKEKDFRFHRSIKIWSDMKNKKKKKTHKENTATWARVS